MYLLKGILTGWEFVRVIISVVVFTAILIVVYIIYNQLEKERAKRKNQHVNTIATRPHKAFYESLLTALIIFVVLVLLAATCGRV
jgi:Na+/H+ antiporter NhaD/arsenite permease-like protein